jgi:hypothetical protein
LAATRAHQADESALPADLSLRGVSQLLADLGVQVSRRFHNLFRDTAILMRMGRNQGMARLAATRRQQQSRNQPYPPRDSMAQSTLYAPRENEPVEDKPAEDRPTEDNPAGEEAK